MSSADTYAELQDRKVNGPKGFKTTSRSVALGSSQRLIVKMYWRAKTDLAPGFAFQVTYHYPRASS